MVPKGYINWKVIKYIKLEIKKKMNRDDKSRKVIEKKTCKNKIRISNKEIRWKYNNMQENVNDHQENI